LEQVEKIIKFTGSPTVEDLKAIEAVNAEAVTNQLEIKGRSVESYFPHCDH
jgi:uncharacterized protein with HEPN domain